MTARQRFHQRRTGVVAHLLAALLLVAAPLAAGELAGVRMPDSVEIAGKSLVLNGMGIRKATILRVKVYVAGLYLETRSRDPAAILASAQAKRITLRFLRDVSHAQITEAFSEGFEKNAGPGAASLKPRIATLNGWMPDLATGDSLEFTQSPAARVEVRVNGQLKGAIQGEDFARGLWSLWLGPEPPNEDLKDGLLGR